MGGRQKEDGYKQKKKNAFLKAEMVQVDLDKKIRDFFWNRKTFFRGELLVTLCRQGSEVKDNVKCLSTYNSIRTGILYISLYRHTQVSSLWWSICFFKKYIFIKV